MSSMLLSPFKVEHFPLFSSWFETAKNLYVFGGPQFTFPLDEQQLQAYSADQDKHAYCVVDKTSNETVGHCEFNYSEEIPTLSRLFITAKRRGEGLGEELVRMMSQMLFEKEQIHEIQLYVFEFNTAARKCYEKVGFTIRQKETTYLKVEGEVWTRLKMKLTRKEFEMSQAELSEPSFT